MLKKFLMMCSAALFSSQVMAANAPASVSLNPENVIYMELKDGRVVIELLPTVAPNHVARIKQLAREGFYDDVVFHRVIEGFMAQTGDPTGSGMGGSSLPDLKAEFNPTPHVRGTVSMARAGSPNSANSQFFICFDKTPDLDGKYTVFGRVVQGMEFVDNIKKGDAMNNGTVVDPDRIISMKVAADVHETNSVVGISAEEQKQQAAPAPAPTTGPAPAGAKKAQ